MGLRQGPSRPIPFIPPRPRPEVAGISEHFVTPEQLSEHLQISVRDVNELARLGKIPGHPIPSRTGKRPRMRFKISEVEQFMPSNNAVRRPR